MPDYILRVTPEEFGDFVRVCHEDQSEGAQIGEYVWMRFGVRIPRFSQVHVEVEKIAPSVPWDTERVVRLEKFDGLANLAQACAWEARFRQILEDRPLKPAPFEHLIASPRYDWYKWELHRRRKLAVPLLRWELPTEAARKGW